MALANSWCILEVHCSQDIMESLGALLMERGALGIEEKAESLSAYFSAEVTEEEQLHATELLGHFRVPPEQWKWSMHTDDGWSTRWKEFFHPLEIGERLAICPSWEEYEPPASRKVLWLDPGMAFGTGQHPTTKGTLLLIEKHMPEDEVIFDVGCGSGILSLGALLLGAPFAKGVDIDPDSITVAYENAEANKLSDKVEFSTTPITEIEESFTFVVANIQAHILEPMVLDLKRVTKANGILILSGILESKFDQLLDVFSQEGFSTIEIYREEEWCTVALRASY